MDDSGVADAFYTVLSIGIVLVAALAVSGVVLSATAGQGKDAGARLADYGEGREKGLYSFYYAVDEARSDYASGDPTVLSPAGSPARAPTTPLPLAPARRPRLPRPFRAPSYGPGTYTPRMMASTSSS